MRYFIGLSTIIAALLLLKLYSRKDRLTTLERLRGIGA